MKDKPPVGGVGVSPEEDFGFEEFWSAYPRKVGKQKAERAWKNIKPEEVPDILAFVEAWKKTEDWTKERGRYIPYPANFLNDRRWEDEVQQEVEIEDFETRPFGAAPFPEEAML